MAKGKLGETGYIEEAPGQVGSNPAQGLSDTKGSLLETMTPDAIRESVLVKFKRYMGSKDGINFAKFIFDSGRFSGEHLPDGRIRYTWGENNETLTTGDQTNCMDQDKIERLLSFLCKVGNIEIPEDQKATDYIIQTRTREGHDSSINVLAIFFGALGYDKIIPLVDGPNRTKRNPLYMLCGFGSNYNNRFVANANNDYPWLDNTIDFLRD